MSLADTYSPQVAVLGSMLISPELVGEVMTKVRPEDFLDGKCRSVYCAIRSVFSSGSPVDPVTVRDKLGGPADGEWSQMLLQLMEVTPTATNVWEYVALMQSQARLARAAELGGRLQVCQDEDRLQELAGELYGLLSQRQDVKRFDMEGLLLDFVERHSAPHSYISWGVPKLDANLYAEPGDMIVLGGYPSAGKTALAVSFAWHMAQRYRVGFYSLETSRFKLADRLISNIANIELSAIKHGEIGEEDWRHFKAQSGEMTAVPLSVIEAAGMTASDIRADALAHRYQVVYLDYLQIVQAESRRENRTNQVAQISRDLQQLAHSAGITVVALSQLSRGDGEQEPTMADLRESGQIEQDADVVMLLYLEEPKDPLKSRRILKIGKNKEGTMGRVYLAFDGEHQRFRESVYDAPVPDKRAASYRQRRGEGHQYNLFVPEPPAPVPDPFPPEGGEQHGAPRPGT